MRRAHRAWGIPVALAALALLPASVRAQWLDVPVPDRPDMDAADVEAGRSIYERHCWTCHGEKGDGRGPVARYLWPKPRDFTIASFKLRTTASGELPTEEDLFRSITHGLPGSAMPAWGEVLSAEERWQVIAYLETFAEGLFEDPAFDPYRARVDLPPPPPGREDDWVRAGRVVWERSDCGECHGDRGRGDGARGPDLKDDRGFPDPAADLESSWKFRGGVTPADLYMRLSTGLDGSPMPSYARSLTEEERWQVAWYVASLALDDRRERHRSVVIPAGRTDGPLPRTVGDPAWEEAEEVWVPLTGQATFPPRWQVPSVNDLEVRALYDATGLALRLRWNDRVADREAGDPEAAYRVGWTARTTFPALFEDGWAPSRFPDEAEILFPSEKPRGLALPHFVYGDERRPVEVWRWSAAREGGVRLTARGATEPPEPRPEARDPLAADASWEGGRWTLLVRAPLGATAEGVFRGMGPGDQVPIALHVRDGSSGETGLRMALSPWSVLYLEQPAGAWRIGLVLMAVLAAGALEVAAVRAARVRNAATAPGRF